jgi:SAM-dependent methyltransferase
MTNSMKQDTMPQVAKYWNDIATQFDAIYTGKDKTGLAKAMDQYFRKDIYQRFDWVMEKAGDVQGKNIIDFGCGSGRFVTEFVKRGAAHVTGVDVAPEMIKLSTQLTTQDGTIDRCDLHVSDSLHWKSGTQHDITIAIGFWDYIMDPPERMRVMHKATKPGGKYLTAWPRFWTWRMPVRKVRLEYLDGCPVYFFTKQDVYRMHEESGFEVVDCRTVGKLFCVEARPK